MRVAVFIIILFLGMRQLNILPDFWVSALVVLAGWRLLEDYYELKKWRHEETHKPLSLKKRKK